MCGGDCLRQATRRLWYDTTCSADYMIELHIPPPPARPPPVPRIHFIACAIIHNFSRCTMNDNDCNKSRNSNSSTSTRAASRKNRVYVFRQFLLDTYKEYLLRDDDHAGSVGRTVVLDCAGGKGDLSWLLRNIDSIDSVVVDPRLIKNRHIVKSVKYLRDNPLEAQKRAIPNQLTYQPLATLMPKLQDKEPFQSPRHLRLLVNKELVTAVRSYRKEQNSKAWLRFWEEASNKAKEAQPLGYKEEETTDSTSILDAIQALETILITKLVVGFHPDQATDPCMDLAQELGVPFCVVPCCVFPSEFPHRRLLGGNRVRDYKGLLEYLQSKHPAVQTARLPFHFTETAKNIVLYTL